MCLGGMLVAQQKELDLKTAMLGAKTTLAVEKARDLQWIADTEYFSYIGKKDSIEVLFHADARQNTVESLLSLDSFNKIIAVHEIDELKEFPTINWLDKNRFWIWAKNSLVVFDVVEKRLSIHASLTDDAKNRDVSDSSLHVAFTKGSGLYIANELDVLRVLAPDSGSQIVVGQDVHRREFGIRKGTFWSPKNNQLAFYEKDISPVTDYPFVDFSTLPATTKPGKYPMAGMANHIARVGVYNLANAEVVYLQTGGPTDQYLTNLSWSPDEKYIYLAQINRDQNHLKFYKYDAATGEQLKLLFEEKSPAYVDPQVGAYFVNENPDQFLWLSRRDGWNHLYLYNSDGQLIKQLTSGEWEIISLKGTERKGRKMYFVANRESPVERDLYAVDLKRSTIDRLTERNGTHSSDVSASGRYFLDTFSSLEIPGLQELRATNGGLLRVLSRGKNPLRDYRVGEVDIVPFLASDSSKLFGRVMFPPDFTPSKKYPLLVYVYGGPHSQQVRNSWMGGNGRWPFWLRYMATQGYLVLTVDNRGTNYRGLGFEQATFRQLGTIEVADQIETVAQLSKAGYVDTSRIAVVGWSYGGFMASSLILRAPEVFKVAVAGGPVTDWKYYETIYTERYMDTPDTNEEGYKTASLMSHVDKLKGKLLLIHGTSDPIVVWQHSIALLDAAINKSKHIDYAIYPGEPHGVRGKKSLHLFEKMTRYIKDNL